MSFTEVTTPEELINLRREIHKRPEPGWTEFISTARAITQMERMGFEVRCGPEAVDRASILGANAQQIADGLAFARANGVSEELLARMDGITGAVGVMKMAKPGPVVALRFDLDCVPVTETSNPDHVPNKEGFASCRPGYMHACGHDSHQAIGLTLAAWIAANKDQLCGTVKLIFQPAEEGGRGALPMTKAGMVDDVDFLYCGHVGCDIPGGTVIVAPLKFLCSCKIDFHFKGTASHSAMQPEVGRNRLMAAVTATYGLMSLPRHGEGMTRVNVGTLRAGEGRNVIASTADMQTEVRGENEKILNYMFDEAMMRVTNAAAMYGVTVTHEILGQTVDFVPDEEASARIREVAAKAPHVTTVQETMNFNGSEDATLLIKRVQAHGGKAGYIVVGSTLKGGHHQGTFDFEEKHIWTLYNIFQGLLVHHLGNK